MATEKETRIDSWSKRLEKKSGIFYEVRIRILSNEIPDSIAMQKLEANLRARAGGLIKILAGGSLITEFTEPEKLEVSEVKSNSENNKPTTV